MDTMSWEKVAKKLGRTPNECECHYFDNYVLYPKIKGLECVNKNAFRFDRFDNVDTNMTNALIGDALELEGIIFFFLIGKYYLGNKNQILTII